MPYRRTRQSSPFMSPPILIVLLPIIALTILFFAVPPLLSATSHVLRPSSVVKKSWGSLNILLVVFAILCGVFARRNDDESQQQQDAVPDRNVTFRKMSSEEEEVEEGGGEGGSGGYVSQQWFGLSEERNSYNPTPMLVQSPAASVTRLRRSSSSYPDLRSWETGDDRFRFRFFDDFEIDKQFQSPARDQITTTVDLRTRLPGTEEVVQVKEIQVDTFETRSSPPHPEPPPESPAHHTPPPPPPPPPPPVNSRRKQRRAHQKVDNISEITELDEDRELTDILPPPTAPPTPPPPPPPAPVKKQSEHKHKRSERRKSSVKRDIATVWASVLSNQKKKKKKQRPKTDHNHKYDNVIDELTNSNTIPPRSPAPPPPPPPPPPPSVFHSLFRKGLGKSKKIHSVSAPPPPPPPPPLTSSRRWSKWKSPIPQPPPVASDPPQPRRHKTVGRPPLPNKSSSFYAEAVNAGNQSPLIPVPPPPPPFNMPAMKFVVRGDFVRIRSNQSSLCSSPERDEIDTTPSTAEELETSITVSAVTNSVTDRNGDTVGSVFCPSPDVNVKAATFIARLRGEWKLEMLNSLKEKGNDSLPLKGYHF